MDIPYCIAAGVLIYILFVIAFMDYNVRRATKDPNEKDEKE